MMRTWLVALVLAFGCKSSPPTTSPPPPPPPTTGTDPGPSDGSAACGVSDQATAMTPEQCTCLGGRLNLSRGGEQEHCGPEEVELGAVRMGIEGGWCCKGR